MSCEFPQTLVEAVEQKVADCPDAVAFFEQTTTGFVPRTHRELHQAMQAASRTLRALDVSRGDRIGVLGRPSYRWEVADKAILHAGGVTVGLDHKSAPRDLGYMVECAGLRGIFVEDWDFLDLVPEAQRTALDFVVLFHGDVGSTDTMKVVKFDEAVAAGGADELRSDARSDDVAVIIFTSGTTGPPKGIPLTHRKLTATLPPMRKNFAHLLGKEHRTLAWLPLHNGTGRMMSSVNYYLGATQYFVADPLTLFEHIKTVHPTYVVMVPRILEKVYERVQSGLAAQPLLKRLLFRTMLAVRGRSGAGWLRLMTERLGMEKVREAIWGKGMQFFICGSAPINPRILGFFEAMGLPTYEVYGLSELAVLVSMNHPGRVRYGSVGEPMEIIELRIAQDGEILAKSGAALDRYWGEESGADLFDAAGYLKTGDLGELRDGYLYITGRKKEIIKTSTGQRVAPIAIESHYSQVPGVEQIMVVGNNRKYLSALVEMDCEFAASLEAEGRDVHAYLRAEFEFLEGELAPNRRIQGFAVLPRSLTIEAGELTPTLKLRRHAIEQRYADLIESIYVEGEMR